MRNRFSGQKVAVAPNAAHENERKELSSGNPRLSTKSAILFVFLRACCRFLHSRVPGLTLCLREF
jgi:hypothetical protein